MHEDLGLRGQALSPCALDLLFHEATDAYDAAREHHAARYLRRQRQIFAPFNLSQHEVRTEGFRSKNCDEFSTPPMRVVITES